MSSLRRVLACSLLLAALGLAACSHNDGSQQISALAKQLGVTDPKAASSRLIGHDDLPPEGTRSLFDHLVAQADGVPYPFEKLVALIAKQDPSGAQPLVLMIPDGRSLLKAQADYVHPRLLVGADFQAPNTPASLGIAARGQLFVGFTSNANEIEVMSYNEAAGRFEFQLVQDYQANGRRKLVYAKRAICLTCHQGGAPIFSQRPWNETNGQAGTAAKIAEARAKVGEDATHYLGFPIANPLSVPERFEELTNVGSFFAATQKLWIDRCADAACRRALLKLALAYVRTPGDFDPNSAAAKAFLQLQAQGNLEPIQVPQSELLNRDPISQSKGIKARLHAFFSRQPKLGDGAKTNEDLAAFDQLPKLPALQDPLSIRAPKRTLTASDIDAVYGIASLFTPDDIRSLQEAAGFNWGNVDTAIARLPDAAFMQQPFSRVKMMQALLAPGVMVDAGKHGPPQLPLAYCCLDTTELSPPIASGEPPVTLTAHSPLLPFQQYCFACHRGNPAKRLNFMSGATEAAVLQQLQAKSEVRDVLDWSRYQNSDKAHTLMPPADSPQHALLAAAVAKDAKLLERMRAVVPSLFDF